MITYFQLEPFIYLTNSLEIIKRNVIKVRMSFYKQLDFISPIIVCIKTLFQLLGNNHYS